MANQALEGADVNMKPDPIAEPDAYRTMLLTALASDDPAAVQAETPRELRSIVNEAGPLLDIRPAPREWSVLELVGHFVDAELVVAGRVRWILAHDEPDLMPYDQELWVERLRHREEDAGALLDLFEALRRADLDLWRRSSSAERARIGHHTERGPESYDLTFRMLAGHDRIHLEQMRRTVTEARRLQRTSVAPAASG
jgi:hypothetical protein